MAESGRVVCSFSKCLVYLFAYFILVVQEHVGIRWPPDKCIFLCVGSRRLPDSLGCVGFMLMIEGFH